MRYLILSDIHSNREALAAVLADAAGLYDCALCCGDLVGYCADPNTVVDYIRESGVATVRGNHDRACAGLEDLEWFNPVARASAMWTREALTPANLDFLISLPAGPLDADSCQIVHGSPVDEDEYLISLFDADQALDYLGAAVTFFGHTHLQGGFRWHNGGRAQALPKVVSSQAGRVIELEPDSLYLINPGSVGQPRDRDPRAAYALYDPGQRIVTLRRVPYDVAAAAHTILAAGLPELLAFRLQVGQ